MISGAHVMIFTQDEAADRVFLRDVLEIPCIDSGGGWLIFKLPPAELGVHSGDNGFHQFRMGSGGTGTSAAFYAWAMPVDYTEKALGVLSMELLAHVTAAEAET